MEWRTEMSSRGGGQGLSPLGKQLDNMAAAQGKNGLKIGVSGSIVCREQSEPQE